MTTTRRCSMCRKKVNAECAVFAGIKAFCCWEHLFEWTKTESARKLAEKSRRKEITEQRKRLSRRSEVLRKAQMAFNLYIRVRDQNKPCICCARPLEGDAIGGRYDCGHYRSVGSCNSLRFDTRNAHGQLKYCNNYLGGNVVEYRKGLIRRFGQQFVEDLENDTTTRKMTKDYLERIAKVFNKKARLYRRKFR